MTEKNLTQDTEGKILGAAKKVFEQKGMDGARMQEIANEAGINKAMLHYYYRNKQKLFEAVFKSAFSILAPQLNKILNDDTSIEEKIKSFTDNYIYFFKKHPYLPNFVIQESNRNPVFFEKIQQINGFPSLEKFKKQVASEVEQGLLRPIDGEQLFVSIISLNIFPFVASPLIKGILKLDDESFEQLMENRKTAVSDLIIHSIKIT
jgi:AcrR family transcriptional regulator